MIFGFYVLASMSLPVVYDVTLHMIYNTFAPYGSVSWTFCIDNMP